jgi:phosphoglycerol transferase MdoB-like AlkP superfamily enzyme
VILNTSKAPYIDERVVSQIDLPPTLLSLIGIENYSPMLGHDLNNTRFLGRAIMQYSDNFAYMQENNVVILQPQKSPRHFYYDFNKKTLSPQKERPYLSDIALAHALWGSIAYNRQWYQ